MLHIVQGFEDGNVGVPVLVGVSSFQSLFVGVSSSESLFSDSKELVVFIPGLRGRRK